MTDQLRALLDAGDYTPLALALMAGLGGALFTALLWLRLFRWVFALFGVKA